MASFFDSSLPPWLIPPDYAKTFNDAFANSANVAARNRDNALRQKMSDLQEQKYREMKAEEERDQVRFGRMAAELSQTTDPLQQQVIATKNMDLLDKPRTAQGMAKIFQRIDVSKKDMIEKQARDDAAGFQVELDSAADTAGRATVLMKWNARLSSTDLGRGVAKTVGDQINSERNAVLTADKTAMSVLDALDKRDQRERIAELERNSREKIAGARDVTANRAIDERTKLALMELEQKSADKAKNRLEDMEYRRYMTALTALKDKASLSRDPLAAFEKDIADLDAKFGPTKPGAVTPAPQSAIPATANTAPKVSLIWDSKTQSWKGK